MTFFDRSIDAETENRPLRVLFSIQHPAHVHLFRNAISDLQERGEEVEVYAREKEIVSQLLQHYDIDHEILAPKTDSALDLAKVELLYEYRLTKRARRFDPDVMVAMGGVAISRPGMLTGAKRLVFTDTEHATLQNTLAFPFATRICTPDCYQDEIGKKQVYYCGYHELAYLHPNRFEPDPSILAAAGLHRDEQFVILRLVSWDAMHDVGDSGFEDVVDVVHALEETGVTVRITSEADLPAAIEGRQVSIPPHRMHDLMAFADLYVGESATMATESAVLGTPAVFVSSSRRGYTDELEKEYGLVFNYSDEERHERGLQRALDILETNDPEQWEQRRERMLDDKVDTTKVITGMVRKLAR
jgi:uncharacterized protein